MNTAKLKNRLGGKVQALQEPAEYSRAVYTDCPGIGNRYSGSTETGKLNVLLPFLG